MEFQLQSSHLLERWLMCDQWDALGCGDYSSEDLPAPHVAASMLFQPQENWRAEKMTKVTQHITFRTTTSSNLF
jgi:hypothetical protein